MNRKCKKIGIFIGLTMAIAGMTACGETEPEETPVVKKRNCETNRNTGTNCNFNADSHTKSNTDPDS